MAIERSTERIDETGEVFTPEELVNEILDEVPEEFFTDASKTICEPSVGEGVFLVEILKRRILTGLNPTKALHTLYGVDIMEDNIQVCKYNLLTLAGDTPLSPYCKSTTMSAIIFLGLDIFSCISYFHHWGPGVHTW